jgi:starch synthase
METHMTEFKHILHVAAENDALPGAKVGGIGDVVRDMAPALADWGCRVTVVVPSHGFLHQLPGARHRQQIGFFFRGAYQVADLFEVPARKAHPRVRHMVVHHPFLNAYDHGRQEQRIYVHDPESQPFYSDASRFACFGTIVATAATQGVWAVPDAIHLHDWHAAFVALLRRYDPFCQALQSIRTVFTIHNLALQGIRPLRDSESSLEAWFPGLGYEWLQVSDPRWPNCCNMMACGIRLADRVHAVSPTYAREICQPDNKPHAYGAEGLEAVTGYAHASGVLCGVLNGCAYPENRQPPRMAFHHWLEVLKAEVLGWCGSHATLPTTHYLAVQRLSDLQRRSDPPPTVLTSVSRAVDQKLLILRSAVADNPSALHAIMQLLGDKGCYILLGAGEEAYHRFLTQVSAQHPNFIFLNGYSERCAQLLYANGDLFLMPSSFEPCGISQMLAMRDGQPCVAHAVGGLKDTIRHEQDGFLFEGASLNAQGLAFIDQIRDALRLKDNSPQAWQEICCAAAEARFEWIDSARHYMHTLYGILPDAPA